VASCETGSRGDSDLPCRRDTRVGEFRYGDAVPTLIAVTAVTAVVPDSVEKQLLRIWEAPGRWATPWSVSSTSVLPAPDVGIVVKGLSAVMVPGPMTWRLQPPESLPVVFGLLKSIVPDTA